MGRKHVTECSHKTRRHPWQCSGLTGAMPGYKTADLPLTKPMMKPMVNLWRVGVVFEMIGRRATLFPVWDTTPSSERAKKPTTTLMVGGRKPLSASRPPSPAGNTTRCPEGPSPTCPAFEQVACSRRQPNGPLPLAHRFSYYTAGTPPLQAFVGTTSVFLNKLL